MKQRVTCQIVACRVLVEAKVVSYAEGARVVGWDLRYDGLESRCKKLDLEKVGSLDTNRGVSSRW